jgi:hypothetical protein
MDGDVRNPAGLVIVTTLVSHPASAEIRMEQRDGVLYVTNVEPPPTAGERDLCRATGYDGPKTWSQPMRDRYRWFVYGGSEGMDSETRVLFGSTCCTWGSRG